MFFCDARLGGLQPVPGEGGREKSGDGEEERGVGGKEGMEENTLIHSFTARVLYINKVLRYRTYSILACLSTLLRT